MQTEVLINDVIKFLGAYVLGIKGEFEGLKIRYLKPTAQVDMHTLDWVNANCADKQRMAEQTKARIILVDNDVKYSSAIENQRKGLIYVDNPKLAIALVAGRFFAKKKDIGIHPSVVIDNEAVMGEDVRVGANSVIGNCVIGNKVDIHSNVTVYDNCVIGDNVEIHAGMVIGCEAHNFVSDEHGATIKFPHLGSVIIEDDVVIGANSVICRGVLGDTIVGRGTKIAQNVLVGANNLIGSNCAIRGGAKIAGSVRIGNNAVIGLAAMIRDQITIGANAFIGMGAVVTKNVPDGEIWIGNPAKKLVKR